MSKNKPNGLKNSDGLVAPHCSIAVKATGITRKIDDLGRIVIPKETRKILNISVGDSLEIYVDENNQIILKKYELNICNNCGNRINQEDLYCKFCGEKQEIGE